MLVDDPDVGREVSRLEDVPLVQTLLVHGADCNIPCVYDRTALLCAAARNYPNVVRLLVEHGANINAQDSIRMTPLMCAMVTPDDDTAMPRLLLEHGANVTVENVYGTTALHWAVWTEKNKDTLRLMLAHGADPNHADKDGVTPIILAQQQHRPDLVALLRKYKK